MFCIYFLLQEGLDIQNVLEHGISGNFGLIELLFCQLQ